MKKSTPFWPTQHEIDAWFECLPGKHLAATMQQQVDQLLANVFGYYSVSLGLIPSVINFDSCRISRKFLTTPIAEASSQCILDLQALPFPQNSIDLFILPQGFDFICNPQAMLAEVSRCLINEGRVLLFGFNAHSLFGLWRWLLGDVTDYPWRGQFNYFSKVKKFLIENDFEIETAETFYFRPPFTHAEALNKLKFIEVLGPLLWRRHGAMYAILARKRTSCLTAIRTQKTVYEKTADLVAVHRSSHRL